MDFLLKSSDPSVLNSEVELSKFLFDVIRTINELNFSTKIYLVLVHLFILSLLCFVIKRKLTAKEKSRTIRVPNGSITDETCRWLDSTIQWLFQHSQTGRTPQIVALWIKALNRQLVQDGKGLKISIEDLCSGSLPPNFVNVSCEFVSGDLQCLIFQVESKDLGFLMNASQSTSDGKSSRRLMLNMEVKGKVALKLKAKSKSLATGISFIGDPEININTTVLQEDGSEPPSIETIEEKVKDVICKTVTNVAIQKDENVKEKLLTPSSESCLGSNGKLLIKVIKATELQGKVKNAPISPYCVIYTDNPTQRKRTSMLKDDNNPFWNEYLAFDVNPKTMEITFDLFDHNMTSPELNCHLDETEAVEEKDDFLGQVVVPLATVNSSQTCRMAMPVLPKSYRSEYAHGQLSLEFTFDKDGKVMETAIPLIADQAKFVEQTVGVSQSQIENSKEENGSVEATDVVINGYQETSLNGYVLGTSKYLDTSLDDLAHEIELYEAGELEEEKSEDVDVAVEEKEQIEEPDAGSPVDEGVEERKATVEVSEEVKLNDEPEQKHEPEPEEDVEEIKEQELEKEQEPDSSSKTKKKFSLRYSLRKSRKEKQEETKDVELHETSEPLKEDEEQVTEPKANKKWFRRQKSSKTKQEAPAEEAEQKSEEQEPASENVTEQGHASPEAKPSRWSFKSIKSRSSKKTNSNIENAQAVDTVMSEQPLLTQDSDVAKTDDPVAKTDDPVEQTADNETIEEVRTTEPVDEIPPQKVTPVIDDHPELSSPPTDEIVEKDTEEISENTDTVPEIVTPPKSKHKTQRPVSMVTPSTSFEGDSHGKSKTLERERPERHSFHGGDLDRPNLRKSSSDTSMLSYTPNQYSTLMIEVKDSAGVRYYVISKPLQNRKCYDIRGTNIHVYNDHMFFATNFSESLKCDVCDKPISGIFVRKGYECSDCKMRVHKRCHCQTSTMCASSTLKEKNLIYLPDIYGHTS